MTSDSTNVPWWRFFEAKVVTAGGPAGATGSSVFGAAGSGESVIDVASAGGSLALMTVSSSTARRPSGLSLHLVGMFGGSPVLSSSAGVSAGASVVSGANVAPFDV